MSLDANRPIGGRVVKQEQ